MRRICTHCGQAHTEVGWLCSTCEPSRRRGENAKRDARRRETGARARRDIGRREAVAQARERAGDRCEACGAGDEPLQAHHASRRVADGGGYGPDDELRMLCGACHRRAEAAGPAV